jgi:hypothetical protein
VSDYSASSDWLSLSLRRTALIVLAYSERTVLVVLRMAIFRRCLIGILIRDAQDSSQW